LGENGGKTMNEDPREQAHRDDRRRTAVERETFEHGQAAEYTWRNACQAEFCVVRGRAEELEKKLVEREHLQRQRVLSHEEERPTKPNALAMILGARPSYERALASWAKVQTGLERTDRWLGRQIEYVHEQYGKEAIAGYPTKGMQLAMKLTRQRLPDLVEEVEAFQAFRKTGERELIQWSKQVEKRRERGGISR